MDTEKTILHHMADVMGLVVDSIHLPPDAPDPCKVARAKAFEELADVREALKKSTDSTAIFICNINERVCPGLIDSMLEMIVEGWGLNSQIKITPLMVAAALQKEALSAQHWPKTAAGYPCQLNWVAGKIAELEAQKLTNDATLNGQPGERHG